MTIVYSDRHLGIRGHVAHSRRLGHAKEASIGKLGEQTDIRHFSLIVEGDLRDLCGELRGQVWTHDVDRHSGLDFLTRSSSRHRRQVLSSKRASPGIAMEIVAGSFAIGVMPNGPVPPAGRPGTVGPRAT